MVLISVLSSTANELSRMYHQVYLVNFDHILDADEYWGLLKETINYMYIDANSRSSSCFHYFKIK